MNHSRGSDKSHIPTRIDRDTVNSANRRTSQRRGSSSIDHSHIDHSHSDHHTITQRAQYQPTKDSPVTSPTSSPTMMNATNVRYEVTSEERLKLLGEEISEGIKNLSSLKKDLIEKEIESCREEARQRSHPYVDYCILLFRKYADIANKIKDAKSNSSKEEIISFENESGTADQGHQVWFRSKILWYRCIAAILSLISFIIMSNVKLINYADVHAQMYQSGSFNYRPYQFVLAVGVLLWAYNLLYIMYYLLPYDSNQNKYLPGGWELLLKCMSPSLAAQYIYAFRYFISSIGIAMGFILDLILLAEVLIASLIGSIQINEPTEIKQLKPATEIYYTIDTFFRTYGQTDCFRSQNNPVPLIRAALAMLYLSLLFQVLYCYISWNSVNMYMKSRSTNAGFNTLPVAQEVSESVHGTSDNTASTISYASSIFSRLQSMNPLARLSDNSTSSQSVGDGPTSQQEEKDWETLTL